MPRALAGAPLCPLRRFGLRGRRPSLGGRLGGGGLLANVVACPARLAAGAAAAQPQPQHPLFNYFNNTRKVLALYEVKCPLCRNRQIKNFSNAACRASRV